MAGLQFVSNERPTDAEALDAYSQVVTRVAQLLSPSVANVRLRRGAGSAVAITPDGFLLTSAHVVERARGGALSLRVAPCRLRRLPQPCDAIVDRHRSHCERRSRSD